MQFPQNIATFLKQFPLEKMKGEEIFLVIAFFLAKGSKDTQVDNKNIKKNWSKGLLGKSYNPSFAHRAKGWIHPLGSGLISLTDEGIEHVESSIQSESLTKTGLIVFKKGNAHSFDKFLRKLLKNATKNVDLADTYVDGEIFDNLLDEIPQNVPIRFVFGNDKGGFVSKSVRFSRQYSFQKKESREFHDRFVIIDGKGYIVGPSLKDAADRKPATLVVLSETDSGKLESLFLDIWTGS